MDLLNLMQRQRLLHYLARGGADQAPVEGVGLGQDKCYGQHRH